MVTSETECLSEAQQVGTGASYTGLFQGDQTHGSQHHSHAMGIYRSVVPVPNTFALIYLFIINGLTLPDWVQTHFEDHGYLNKNGPHGFIYLNA